MKKILNILGFVAALTMFASCDKVDDLPFYDQGSTSALSASAVAIAPIPADSNNVVVTFNWTYPKHSTDSTNHKYVLEIDSVGKSFGNPLRSTVLATLSTSYTAKQLNNFLLSKSYAFNVPVSMEARLISSYGNNNDQKISNIVPLQMTPYKIPPKVALPVGSRLWANGGALPWSWNGAPPSPQSELARLDNETWGGVFSLNANDQFLILSQNGGSNPYDKKYAVPNNQLPTITTGGNFGFYPPGTGGDNFKSPSNTGWYKFIMNFQSGTFTINSFGTNALAQDLYITGDATVGGWVNNPPPAQRFTRMNSSVYELTIAFVPGKAYKFLSSSGNWQPQFGGNNAAGGPLGANYGSGGDPDAIPTPASAGNYKIVVNFLTERYSVTRL
ncbi:MAG: SusE domain-containing protein [Ferruginibacter sp.]